MCIPPVTQGRSWLTATLPPGSNPHNTIGMFSIPHPLCRLETGEIGASVTRSTVGS